MPRDSGKRNISGTWGKVLMDGEQIAEVYKLQAKLNYTKEKVPQCGNMVQGSKVMAIEPKGTLGLRHTRSRMLNRLAGKIKDGIDVRFTVVSALEDPDAYGAERVALYDVSFDDLTLVDWEAAKRTDIEAPFTFEDYDLLDAIPEG